MARVSCYGRAGFCRKVCDFSRIQYARGNYSDGKATIMDFKGSQFERDIILWSVRWYVAYPISYRQLEEMMQERGVEVDHSSLNRWVIKYTPALDKAFRQRQRSVGTSCRGMKLVSVSKANGSICIEPSAGGTGLAASSGQGLYPRTRLRVRAPRHSVDLSGDRSALGAYLCQRNR